MNKIVFNFVIGFIVVICIGLITIRVISTVYTTQERYYNETGTKRS